MYHEERYFTLADTTQLDCIHFEIAQVVGQETSSCRLEQGEQARSDQRQSHEPEQKPAIAQAP
jgi:hypothetical protein